MSVTHASMIEFRKFLEGLRQVEGKLPPDLQSAVVEAKVNAAESCLAELARAEQLYRAKADESQAALKEINDLAVRARAAIKGVCGPDSAEYQLVGGTRSSDRKKPQRKVPTPG